MKQAMNQPGRVFVFGSANQDYVLVVEEFPRSGETVMSRSYDSHFGGKGANQAVASATANRTVIFVGTVGTDEQGSRVVANFKAHDIDTRFISRSSEPTGLAVVLVDSSGSNEIVVASGANAALPEETVNQALQAITSNDVVVVQCEIPVARIEQVVRGAALRGATVIVNLAPYTVIDTAVFRDISLLIVNESEARALINTEVPAAELATAVSKDTGCACVVTLGGQGSLYAEPNGGVAHVAAYPVDHVVDTTGAGDVYVGTVAASLALHDDIVTAMGAASAAAARSVSIRGAQAWVSQHTRESAG